MACIFPQMRYANAAHSAARMGNRMNKLKVWQIVLGLLLPYRPTVFIEVLGEDGRWAKCEVPAKSSILDLDRQFGLGGWRL